MSRADSNCRKGFCRLPPILSVTRLKKKTINHFYPKPQVGLFLSFSVNRAGVSTFYCVLAMALSIVKFAV
jgi:hypothetical protein